MQLMIILSLLLNVAVLVPVTGSIILRAGWVEAAYGPASPARGILLSIYLAILVASWCYYSIRFRKWSRRCSRCRSSTRSPRRSPRAGAIRWC